MSDSLKPTHTWQSSSDSDTINIAKEIAEKLHGGDILLLSGQMGSGKTTFTRGLAEALGITSSVQSPTFGILHEYTPKSSKNNIQKIAHIDTYRLKHENELHGIGVEDYLHEKNTLTIIEWPENIPGILHGKKTKRVSIETLSEKKRQITFSD